MEKPGQGIPQGLKPLIEGWVGRTKAEALVYLEAAVGCCMVPPLYLSPKVCVLNMLGVYWYGFGLYQARVWIKWKKPGTRPGFFVLLYCFKYT